MKASARGSKLSISTHISRCRWIATDEADVALTLEVEIEIKEELDIITSASTERPKLFVERILDVE